MAQPEARDKERIKRELKKVLAAKQLPHKIHWNAGTGLGIPRLDCDGVIAGHPFYVEVKRFDGKGKGLTARQAMDLKEYEAAGAFVMLIDSEVALQLFLAWVASLSPRRPYVLPVFPGNRA